MARFEVVTPVRASPQQLFELSLNVDVHTASMAGACEQVIEGVASGHLSLGDTVTWQAIHFGVRWRMTAKIHPERRCRFQRVVDRVEAAGLLRGGFPLGHGHGQKGEAR